MIFAFALSHLITLSALADLIYCEGKHEKGNFFAYAPTQEQAYREVMKKCSLRFHSQEDLLNCKKMEIKCKIN